MGIHFQFGSSMLMCLPPPRPLWTPLDDDAIDELEAQVCDIPSPLPASLLARVDSHVLLQLEDEITTLECVGPPNSQKSTFHEDWNEVMNDVLWAHVALSTTVTTVARMGMACKAMHEATKKMPQRWIVERVLDELRVLHHGMEIRPPVLDDEGIQEWDLSALGLCTTTPLRPCRIASQL